MTLEQILALGRKLTTFLLRRFADCLGRVSRSFRLVHFVAQSLECHDRVTRVGGQRRWYNCLSHVEC